MKTGLTRLDGVSWGGFVMFATSGVVTPICLPEIAETLSISLSESGGLETVRLLLLLVVLILTGILARKWGKKHLLAWGQYLTAIGLLMISYAHTYPLVLLSLMVVGIGGGFTEALINPLVVDLHPKNSGKYLNITNAFYPIGVVVSALLFGELLTLGYSWRIAFRIAAAGALLMGLLFHMSRFPVPSAGRHSSLHLIAQILSAPQFWLFAIALFLGAGVEAAFTFWSRSYVETYLQDVPRAGAIAVVVFAGTMAIGRLLSAKLSHKMSLKTLMICSAILGVGVSSGIPFSESLIEFYALLVFAGFATACFWPTLLAEAADRLPVDATMMFVMLACFGIVGFGITPWIMGIIGDSAGLKAGFLLIPGFFMGLIVFLAAIAISGQQLAVSPPRKDARRKT